jgi:hypothetical protein
MTKYHALVGVLATKQRNKSHRFGPIADKQPAIIEAPIIVLPLFGITDQFQYP